VQNLRGADRGRYHQTSYDKFVKHADILYKEPKDGMIALRSTLEDSQQSEDVNLGYLPVNQMPEGELITIIDVSTLWEEKQQLARKMAEQISTLCHPNLLNLTR
jgi:hypothetical protein